MEREEQEGRRKEGEKKRKGSRNVITCTLYICVLCVAIGPGRRCVCESDICENRHAL